MQGLRAKVSAFSKELQSFTQQVSNGVDELKRTAKAKPWVGPTAFKEGYEELVQRTKDNGEEISEVERVTLNAISLEELLGHCLAQLEDNNKRVESLETHLKEYGYKAEFVPSPRAQHPAVQAAERNGSVSPAPLQTYLWEEPTRRRSYSSPGHLTDTVLDGVDREQSADIRMTTVTPSPMLSSAPSISSSSPSLRELQLKYRRISSAAGSPAPDAAVGANALPNCSVPITSTNLAINASSQQLTKLSLETNQSSLVKTVKDSDAGEESSSTVKSNCEALRLLTSKPLTIRTSQRDLHEAEGDTGSARSQGTVTPIEKGDIIATRLAAGEAPWDMLSLKAAINAASPGTGQVEKAIASATFHPQAAAFTSLLHMCAKHKLWEKALEVFEGMKRHYSGVVPNTVHFSSLISACGTAGRWQEATKVFEEMKAHSVADPQCAPNVITYSALMTACCAGGRPDKAHEVFLDMQARGIKPDHISYSTLIAGYERWGDMEKAKAIFEDMKAAGLPEKGHGGASAKIPSYLEQFSRKLLRTNGTFGSEDQRSNVAERSGEPGHRPWNSFASNSTAGDSPYIGAHYGGGALSRGGSGDLGAPDDDTLALRRSMLHTRSPSQAGFAEGLPNTAVRGAGRGTFPKPHQTPLATHNPASTPSTAQLLQAARGGHRSAFRAHAPSPLSHSFDGTHAAPSPARLASMLAPPPGFGGSLEALQGNPLELAPLPAGGLPPELQPQPGSGDPAGGPVSLGFEAEALSQQLAATPGLGMSVASHFLDAFLQQQMAQPLLHASQARSPLPALPQEAFAAQPTAAPPAANGAPQIAQVTVQPAYIALVQEYNNLPLRFSRQLSLDQMNDAVDYVNAVVEGKRNGGGSSAGPELNGVTPQELMPLELGNQRITALLNCLLQLKRVRLTVRNGQQFYNLNAD